MSNFEPIDVKVKVTPLYYYKITIKSIYENMFTIYGEETYGQMAIAHFRCMLSLCLWTLKGVTKQ